MRGRASNNSRRAPVGEVASVIDDYLNLSGRDIQGYEFGVQYRMPRRASASSPSTATRRTTSSGAPRPMRTRRSSMNSSATVARVARERVARVAAGRRLRRLVLELLRFVRRHLGGDDASRFTGCSAIRTTSASSTTTASRATCCASIPRSATTRGSPIVSTKGARWLRGVTVRGGINNVLDTEPQLADEQYGYFSSTMNPRGRQFTMEVSRKF
jgi:outer membrane receptor protein involved in Fe transport